MQKRSKYLIAVVLALGISGTVFGFGAHHHFSQMSLQDKSEMVQLRISQKLDLDDVQQAKLSELTSHMAGLIKQLREEPSLRDQLADKVLSDQPVDQAAILGKIQQKTELVNQQAPQTVALLANFMDSLNSEQKQRLKRMLEKRHGQRWGHHGENETPHYEQ